MICCLNPQCRKPINVDSARICESCGTALKTLRGRYRAVQPLGQGGFGRTYLAVDEDRLGSRCVIKQFSPQVQGTKSLEKAVQLFNQEAVRLDELGEHPQIPTLLAYFEEDGYLYLVQQFIEGQNLLQVMKQEGAFGERKIRDVLADVLPVLRFVHNRQVIHRDITPMNILRRQTDDRLMLIDFGVAKQVDDGSAEPGTRIGTEGYSPIEQFRSGRAYPASDIYSLGATCLHLMAETKPDSLYDPLNGRWIWREYLQKKGRVVSDQLADILDKMLRDLVGDRYQSADEVMRDLNADSFLPMPRQANPYAPPAAPRPTGAASSSERTASAARSGARQTKPSVPPAVRPPLSQPPLSRPPVSRPSRPGTQIREGDRCLQVLTGHTSWVTSVAVSAIAQRVVSGSLDDSVKVWNLSTGELLFTLTGHTRDVNAIALTPDGSTAISGSDDYTIRLWNLTNGTPIRTMTGHSRDVNALAVSPDGQILVSGGEDRAVRLWQLSTGAPVKTLVGTAGMIRAIAITPDGKQIASGGSDSKIKLWNMQNGDQLRQISGHMNSVNALAVSPDGSLLASGSKDKTIKIWNLQTGELIRTLSGHTREVNAIAITADGQYLVSGSSDTSLKLWSLETGNLIETFSGHADSVNAVAVPSHSKIVISGSSDNAIRIWEMPI